MSCYHNLHILGLVQLLDRVVEVVVSDAGECIRHAVLGRDVAQACCTEPPLQHIAHGQRTHS
eukprot:2553269-Pyramimonas_sp.AAC.1